MYIWIALFMGGLASGFWAGYEIQADKVSRMETYRIAQDTLAKSRLEAKSQEVKQAELKAIEANNELDKANLQAVETINAYHDKLSALRLRDRPVKSGRNAVPKSADTTITDGTAPIGIEFSEEFAGFLKSEALRADEIRNYATTCSQFIDTLKATK